LTEEAREGRDEKKFGVLVVGCRPEPLQAGKRSLLGLLVKLRFWLVCVAATVRACNLYCIIFQGKNSGLGKRSTQRLLASRCVQRDGCRN
jgi:hypothetical protein